MCRSIKTLREPFTVDVTDADVQAAALQYVRKISGFRTPAANNAAAFEAAVRAITAATGQLLESIEVRPSPGALTPDQRAARAREERRSRELRPSDANSRVEWARSAASGRLKQPLARTRSTSVAGQPGEHGTQR